MPLLLAGLGELVTEKAGVLNLGVEGMMLMGALTAVASVQLTGSLDAAVLAAEKQAAAMIAEAARTLAGEEQALQLRYLQTLKEIANERTNTIAFPLPLDLIAPLLKITQDAAKRD